MRWSFPLAVAAAVLASGCSDGPKTTPSSAPKQAEKKDNEKLMEPCHPGCFPAGTQVNTPSGLRAIETIKKGEVVTLVEPDGTATSGAVETVFETCNKLIAVRTDAGTLLTTETQPLCLQAGGFQAAGELKTGDHIWRWADGERTATRVLEVTASGNQATVYNLVVGESKVFAANGFLARGKPPAEKTVE